MPPTHTATTLRRAKAAYKKNSGPTITPAEQRRLARQAELDRRACVSRERTVRKKDAERQKVEKERREREAREKAGIGMATQMIGFSHTQRGMKNGMEGWLGKRKRGVEVKEEVEVESAHGVKRDDEMKPKKVRREEEEETQEPLVRTGIERQAEIDSEESFGTILSLDDEELESLQAPRSCHENAEIEKSDAAPSSSPAWTSGQLPQFPRPDKIPTPPPKRLKTESSPTDWAQYVIGNTQLTREVFEVSPAPASTYPLGLLSRLVSADFEITSDDLFDADLPKTHHLPLLTQDDIRVRDFAPIFTPPKHRHQNSRKILLPSSPTIHSPPLRDQLPTNSAAASSACVASQTHKMTASYPLFSAAQCSFSAGFAQFGLCTQVLDDAFRDEDFDTEDDDEEGPPPAIKPAGPRFSRFGLSTQILRDALAEEDGDNDEIREEDAEDALFTHPGLNRPPGPRSLGDERQGVRMSELGLSTQLLLDAADDELTLSSQ